MEHPARGRRRRHGGGGGGFEHPGDDTKGFFSYTPDAADPKTSTPGAVPGAASAPTISACPATPGRIRTTSTPTCSCTRSCPRGSGPASTSDRCGLFHPRRAARVEVRRRRPRRGDRNPQDGGSRGSAGFDERRRLLPQDRKLHFAMGQVPATDGPFIEFDLRAALETEVRSETSPLQPRGRRGPRPVRGLPAPRGPRRVHRDASAGTFLLDVNFTDSWLKNAYDNDGKRARSSTRSSATSPAAACRRSSRPTSR